MGHGPPLHPAHWSGWLWAIWLWLSVTGKAVKIPPPSTGRPGLALKVLPITRVSFSVRWGGFSRKRLSFQMPPPRAKPSGPSGDGVVVPDQVVPQQQAPLVQDAAAEDARRALCAKRREPIAADDAVRDARRAAVVDRSPRGLGLAVLARHQRGVALDAHVAHGLRPGAARIDGPSMSIAEPLGPTCSEEPTLALTRLSSIVLWLRSIVEPSLKWRAESKA